MSDTTPTPGPAEPYRGASEFRYVDQLIFKGREEETAHLMRQIAIYRGVLLYGNSGAGKSSLINAAVVPEAIKLGWQVDRIRIRPQAGEEIKIERIPLENSDRAPYLSGSIAGDEAESPDLVLSIQEFEQRLSQAPGPTRLLLFDQFEELVTQFLNSPGAAELQDRIVQMLLRLFYSRTLRVKLLLIFRQDYLANITKLLEMAPDWLGQSAWLRFPARERAREIIWAPFQPVEGRPLFEPRFSDELTDKLARQLMEGKGEGLSLTDLQIACLRLWRASDPEDVLARRTVAELIEDYLNEALDRLAKEGLRGTAIALLDSMVTPFGTRNVISKFDAIAKAKDVEGVAEEECERALRSLVRARIIRSEEQSEGTYYEIVSEFLAPRIAVKKQQRQIEKELQREQETLEQERRRQLEADRARIQQEFQSRKTTAALSMAFALLVGVFVIYFVVRGFQLRTAHRDLQSAQQQITALEKQSKDAQRAIALLSTRVAKKGTTRGETMFGSSVLEVAIFILFLYLLLSLVMTGIMEAIAAIVHLRERHLYAALRNLLRDPALVREVCRHPLITALNPGVRGTALDLSQGPVRPELIPAYLSPRIFGLVLLDVFSRDSDSAGGFRSLESLRRGIVNLPPELGRSLAVLISDSGDLAQFRSHLERWFTTAMNGVTTWYKRRVQAILAVIAVVIVVGLNVDAIDMANRISRDSALRASLVAQAQVVAETPGGNLNAAAGEDPLSRIQRSTASLQALNLPIGWTAPVDLRASALGGHIPGWLVSVLALTILAPFWFDVLSRFVSVRFASRPSEALWTTTEPAASSKAKRPSRLSSRES